MLFSVSVDNDDGSSNKMTVRFLHANKVQRCGGRRPSALRYNRCGVRHRRHKKSERAAARTATLSFTSRLRYENHEACEQYRKAVTPVKLSFLRSQVLPIGVAMQKASSPRSSLRSSRFNTHLKTSRFDWLRTAFRVPQGDRP